MKQLQHDSPHSIQRTAVRVALALWSFRTLKVKNGAGQDFFMRNEPVDGYRLPAQFTRYPNTWIRDFAEDSILVRCTKCFCKANASGFIRFRIFWYAWKRRVRFISFIKNTKEQWHVDSILILIHFQSVRVRSCHHQMCFHVFSVSAVQKVTNPQWSLILGMLTMARCSRSLALVR